MKSAYRFNSVKFPLDHIHHGIMAGTGGLGLFFWGHGSTIIISAGLGDFWDHRGGMPWQKEHNYKDIRRELEAKDIDAIRTRFAERVVGNAKRPTLLPFCRVEMRLPAGWKLQECSLDQFTGLVCITAKKQNQLKKITFASANTEDRCFACSGMPAKTAIKLIPSYFLAPAMAERAIEKPETLETDDICWFCQKLPVDDSASLLIKKKPQRFLRRGQTEH